MAFETYEASGETYEAPGQTYSAFLAVPHIGIPNFSNASTRYTVSLASPSIPIAVFDVALDFSDEDNSQYIPIVM